MESSRTRHRQRQNPLALRLLVSLHFIISTRLRLLPFSIYTIDRYYWKQRTRLQTFSETSSLLSVQSALSRLCVAELEVSPIYLIHCIFQFEELHLKDEISKTHSVSIAILNHDSLTQDSLDLQLWMTIILQVLAPTNPYNARTSQI
jgi:hypothetical protein